MITIEIANEQSLLPPDEERLREAVRLAIEEVGTPEARISVAVVDDATIARLNRQFLRHEGPTDVLSFPLEQTAECLEGEIVASAETAQRAGPGFGWTAADELLLYVIHGTLHLAGYDDATEDQRARMQEKERALLARLGVERK